MKLYTEEEIVSFLKKEFSYEINAETFIENLTSIELPSDEEINETAYGHSTFSPSFVAGAKWMHDKIQGGNK
jgi:hypothetical protein